jgi:DNA-binding MarR family transcriptional regulator
MRVEQAYEITWLIRRLFRSMAAAADEYLEDSGISAADRAVMEFLYPKRKLSVPEIARQYQVSRQHIQVTVNRLVDQGLLRSVENPRHKRSRLIRLSDAGRECFKEIRRNEHELIEATFAGISDADLGATRRTLRTLHDKLSGG